MIYGTNRWVYPPYMVGDYLYVRETWFYEESWEDITEGNRDTPSGRYSHRYIYRASSPEYPVNVGVGAAGWRPSIHMPKEAARIFLRVTNVKVERLQDIVNEEKYPGGPNNPVVKEGCMYSCDFIALWNRTIKESDLDKYGWNANPWVWVYEFEKIIPDEEGVYL